MIDIKLIAGRFSKKERLLVMSLLMKWENGSQEALQEIARYYAKYINILDADPGCHVCRKRMKDTFRQMRHIWIKEKK